MEAQYRFLSTDPWLALPSSEKKRKGENASESVPYTLTEHARIRVSRSRVPPARLAGLWCGEWTTNRWLVDAIF